MYTQKQGERARLVFAGITLDEDEEVNFMTRGFFRWWSCVFFLIPILMYPSAKSRSLIVTNKRVIMTNGIIRREQRIVLVSRIQDVMLKQSFIDIGWGTGDVTVVSAGMPFTVKKLERAKAAIVLINGLIEAQHTPTQQPGF